MEGRASAELNIASEKTPEPLLVAAVHAAAEGAVPGGAPGIPEVKVGICMYQQRGCTPGWLLQHSRWQLKGGGAVHQRARPHL